MKTISVFRTFLFAFFILALPMSCSKDDSEPNPPVVDPKPDPEPEPEPEEITGVSVPNSTLKLGALPATSNDAAAPVLEESSSLLHAIKGHKLKVEVPLSSGEAAGFYLRLEEVNSHYDITPSRSSTGGRKSMHSGRKTEVQDDELPVYFIIEFGDDIDADTLCISYTAYDDQGKVGAYVERCVAVLAPGGSSSDFLTTHAWQMVSDKEYLEGELVGEYFPGVDSKEEYEYEIFCNGSNHNFAVEESFRYDFLNLVFSTDGTGGINASTTYDLLDIDATSESCTPVLEEETWVQDLELVWNYNASENKLTIIYLDEEGLMQSVERIDIQLSGDNLVVTYHEPESEEYGYDVQVTTFEPKK